VGDGINLSSVLGIVFCHDNGPLFCRGGGQDATERTDGRTEGEVDVAKNAPATPTSGLSVYFTGSLSPSLSRIRTRRRRGEGNDRTFREILSIWRALLRPRKKLERASAIERGERKVMLGEGRKERERGLRVMDPGGPRPLSCLLALHMQEGDGDVIALKCKFPCRATYQERTARPLEGKEARQMETKPKAE